MSKKTKIVLNKMGVSEFLHSKGLEDILKERAAEIQGRAGSEYQTDTYNAGTRVIASVFTDSAEAVEDNYNNNTLLKALGGT